MALRERVGVDEGNSQVQARQLCQECGREHGAVECVREL